MSVSKPQQNELIIPRGLLPWRAILREVARLLLRYAAGGGGAKS